LFVLCYVCRTAGSAQKKRSLLVAQTLSKALNKAFRSIPGAALRFNLHLKTSAAFLIPFYFFREIFIALFLNKLNNNKAYRVFEGRLFTIWQMKLRMGCRLTGVILKQIAIPIFFGLCAFRSLALVGSFV